MNMFTLFHMIVGLLWSLFLVYVGMKIQQKFPNLTTTIAGVFSKVKTLFGLLSNTTTSGK